MLALTTAGYCAYRWLKRSSDLQAAEDQAAHEMMATMDEEMQSNPVVHMPHHERESSLLQGDDTYLPDGENICFPGPLMRSKIQMDDVLRFIKRKSEECLQKVEEPDQKEAYFFWQMMELRCSKNGLSEKLQQGKGEEPEWLLNLRQLYADEEFKLRNSECGLMTSEMFTLQRPRREGHITPWAIWMSTVVLRLVKEHVQEMLKAMKGV
ncbi:hypothetical protein KOW79_014075 [Hemibagrus wyckioides]|uniref:Uncharacterized protein n=1 Tax=Hemibagrus wyckioides TaxID=337641 RepID=A0A9D3SKP7_9TELE|nr:hypothetical protein KOW79_014075 [Hemibagrus wyckioides]